MTKSTTERLEEMRDHYLGMVNKDVGNALTRLLAYEQAAEKPYGYLEPYDFPRTTATLYPEKDRYAVMPLYAAPVLPKQQSIKLPTTRLWAGVIECYGKHEIIDAIKSAGCEVSND